MNEPTRIKGWPRTLLFAVVALATVGADLGTKRWAETSLVDDAHNTLSRSVVEGSSGAIHFILAKNPGGVASFLHDAPLALRMTVFLGATALAIAAVAHFWRKLERAETALRLALALVVGGALGNLVDCLRYGYVIDFIDVQAAWQGRAIHWPTFNVADIAIVVGAALIALRTMRRSAPATSPASLAPR